jgi:hypothetical protein
MPGQLFTLTIVWEIPMNTLQKLIEAKKAWALWNLLDDLQERLWDRYENEFLEFTRELYNPDYTTKPIKKA